MQYSAQMRENADQKKLRIWTLFTQRKEGGFICFNESPLKIIENDICFILNAPFIIKILKLFVQTFLVMYGYGLIRKPYN